MRVLGALLLALVAGCGAGGHASRVGDGGVSPPGDASLAVGDGAAPSGDGGGYPTTPPAQICGNAALLSGPSSAPAGATVVPAGDDSAVDFTVAGATYWLAPGVHTLGAGEFSQIVPGDGATFIGAPGAILDGQHLNRYAFTQHAKGVTIKYLTIQNFVSPRDEGVVNHDSGAQWTIKYDTITNNKGAGLFLGGDCVASYNCLASNGQYGFQVIGNTTAAKHVTLDHNEIAGNNTDDWERQSPGCGCTGGGKFWQATHVTVTNNYVHDNKSVGLWADTDNVGFDVEGNYISNNDAEGLFYEISYNALIKNNNFIRNALVAGPTNPGFPTGAIYLSESGGDGRVANAKNYSSIEVTGNAFTDNWAGVVLWENADRFCNSPANTSSGVCTLGNPSVVNLSSCASGSIDNPPEYDDCRWKTQNVSVHQNSFVINRANLPNCTIANSCGLQGLFSNFGTVPSWSPYMGSIVEENITFHQHNLFDQNQYTGDWRFMAHDQGTVVDFAGWRAAPYGQDATSTMK